MSLTHQTARERAEESRAALTRQAALVELTSDVMIKAAALAIVDALFLLAASVKP